MRSREARNLRIALPVALLLLLLGVLTACTQQISGTPGPRPTVSGGGDFPSGSDSPTDSASDDSPSDDSPSDDSSSGSPSSTDDSTPSEDGSVSQLCSDMSDSISGPDIGTKGYQAFVGLDILGWGLANGDSDPFATVDAVTTQACPDVRTAVLAKTGTPDLKSLGS